jgi:hypothetical protein
MLISEKKNAFSQRHKKRPRSDEDDDDDDDSDSDKDATELMSHHNKKNQRRLEQRMEKSLEKKLEKMFPMSGQHMAQYPYGAYPPPPDPRLGGPMSLFGENPPPRMRHPYYEPSFFGPSHDPAAGTPAHYRPPMPMPMPYPWGEGNNLSSLSFF